MTFLQLLQPHNHNITWTHHQGRIYSELPETYVAIILSIINFGVLCLGLVVTRAVYKLLNRLGKRYINQIIYPSIVSYHIGGLDQSQFFFSNLESNFFRQHFNKLHVRIFYCILIICFIFYQIMPAFIMPIFLITSSLKNFVFPLRKYTGEIFCYIFEYGSIYILVVSQYQSFFISLFRYICVVKHTLLMENNISIGVSCTCTQLL